MAYVWKFKVIGAGAFPIDMLRYDCCYPVTQKCVEEITASHDTATRVHRRNCRQLFSVELVSRVGSPEERRWASFAWRLDGPVRKERI